ncbi:MAG: hypothetical protein NC095_08225 [Muribaculum sp.]|nr:hypothetical protein [Muribaculum sp.]
MDDLQTQARKYAEHLMGVVAYCLDKEAITDLLADAYEQGWVDRDTRDMKPETQDEFLNGE